MDFELIFDLLRSDGSITVNKSLVQAIGLQEAVLYCELISKYNYFNSRDMLDDEGYFYNTQYDLQASTGLGEKAQRTAIGNLKSFGLIEVELKGMPAKRHFKICTSSTTLTTLLKKGKKKLKALGNSKDTSIGGNLKRLRKELDTDKGSANNTNNNTKQIILNYINVVDSEEYDKDFFCFIFNYYFDKYENHTGKLHPILSKKYIKEVMKNINNFSNEYNINKYDDWERIIDIYFNSNLDCDRNIIHFSQEQILYNRADNLKLIE